MVSTGLAKESCVTHSANGTRAVILTMAILALCMGLAEPSQGQSQPGKPARLFRAGAAATNITPPLGQRIIGGWSPIEATHVHDELHARCLVLDDGKTRLALVVCDNLGIDREVFDQARRWIGKETDLPPGNVLMCSTHTHSATTARGTAPLGGQTLFEYQRFLARRIADGVRRAINNLEPARIGWGSASAPEHVNNRRWLMKSGPELANPFGGVDQARMNPPRCHKNLIKPAGPTDPEVAFISIKSTGGREIALLANYSLHYVGGVKHGDVSADYFGIFADRVQQLLKADRQHPPFVGIMTNGTSGDVNNIHFTAKTPRRKPYEQMTLVAHDVAAKVVEARKKVTYHHWVPLGVRMKDLTLKVRKPGAELLAWAHAVQKRAKDAKPGHRREEIYARRTIAMSKSPDTVAVPLQAVRIGDLGIVAIPFEVFAEIGLGIKRRTPLKRSFTISFGNGSYGYLPTPEQHKLGGYETWLGTSRVELQASRKITDQLLAMLAELKED